MRRFPSSWNSTLAKLGLKIKPRRTKRSAKHHGGYGRRSSLEQLESRELLTGTPWQGSDLVIADFDGDGNPDRLGSLAVSSSSPETWNIDTKTSSAAGMVEKWRVVRTGGELVVGTLPTANHVIGDFNGDGRDDILARNSTGWYMIESRASSNPSDYQGEFLISSWGTVSMSGNWSTPLVGDFNGDGRDDLAAFDESNPANKQWQVVTSSGTGFNAPSTWAQTTITPIAGTIVAGDFNGDGRDDVLFKKSGTSAWAIVVSDGSRFNVFDPTTAVTTNWGIGRKGDFDGDGAEELLGWSNSLGQWETIRYNDHQGMSLKGPWGSALAANTTILSLRVGDANRDGRDDLVIYNTSNNLNKWQVALSQQLADGTNSFAEPTALADGTNDWDRWFQDWDWGPTTAPHKFLNIDAPYQHFIDVFSDVYNTVELELYPGLMKGIEAIDQTKAGNDWDQAALLVDRLEDAGFEADIAAGNVEVDIAVLREWLGVKTNLTAYNVILLRFTE